MAHRYKIAIIGLGMVGDVVRRYFESVGYQRGKNLFCYDADPKKNFFDDAKKAQVVFVCVPTPRSADGGCNTSIVESVVREYASPRRVLVIKSTVEPGTAERLAKKYKALVLFSPEFLTEARAWEDMIHPDRQIVALTANAKGYAKEVLGLLPQAFFSSPGALDAYHFHAVNATEAEIGKYGSNLFGALKVTFANILADVCSNLERKLTKEGIKTSVDYENVRHILAHDSRIGGAWLNVLQGGYRGFGGYCFPKDTDAFIATGHKILAKLNRKSADYTLLKKGIALFEAMRDYNNALLATQGLNRDAVSIHDAELSRKLNHVKIERKES